MIVVERGAIVAGRRARIRRPNGFDPSSLDGVTLRHRAPWRQRETPWRSQPGARPQRDRGEWVPCRREAGRDAHGPERLTTIGAYRRGCRGLRGDRTRATHQRIELRRQAATLHKLRAVVAASAPCASSIEARGSEPATPTGRDRHPRSADVAWRRAGQCRRFRGGECHRDPARPGHADHRPAVDQRRGELERGADGEPALRARHPRPRAARAGPGADPVRRGRQHGGRIDHGVSAEQSFLAVGGVDPQCGQAVPAHFDERTKISLSLSHFSQ